MELIPNKKYGVVKRIKLHTKPSREIEVPLIGIYVKETDNYLIFRGFRVRKQCVVSLKEADVNA